MAQVSDQGYLLTRQYHDGSRLTARGGLHDRFSTNNYGWFPWLFDHVHLPVQSHILELGCGPGWLWLKNMARIPAEWDVTLSDFSAGMVEEARQILHDSPHAFSFAVVDAQEIPYADDTFDAVIANHMLYHVPDRDTALAEIRRVLKMGGRFYASTVGANHLHEMAALIPGHEDDFGRDYPFNLENGGDQVAAHFEHVALHRYDDALVVTEAEPLISYLLSTRVSSSLDDGTRTELVRRVQDSLAAGVIRISKDVGLFEAW